jgi:D-alanyl-D-alanine carboxypeptidase
MARNQSMKIFLAGILLGIFHATRVAAQINPVLAAQLQQILDDRVQFNGNHGVSACLIMPNGDLWKGQAGVGANNVPITDSTVFHGASITKTNVAALILLMVEDGLLNLDSTWDHYVNLNVNFDTTITIRQLIGHTSGIRDYLETAATEGHVTTDFNHAFTPVEILENIVSGTPDFPPGTNFSYSSSNYALAALIAETVAGQPIQQELHDRLWDSLGLAHTYFGGFEAYTEPRAGVWWDFGSGLTDFSNDPETSMLTYGYGGANIATTPEDMAVFARALFVDSLLPVGSFSAMQAFSPQSYPTWTAGYGLGIHNAYAWGTNSVLGHDGYYTNMGDMFHSYDHGFTLVTMTNTATTWVAIFNAMYDAVRDHLVATGTEAVVSSGTVRFFPNPVRDRLVVDLGGVHGRVAITVTDIAGRVAYAGEHEDAAVLEVSTNGWDSGVYIAEVRGEGVVERVKIIID